MHNPPGGDDAPGERKKMKARKMKSIEALEKYVAECRRNGVDIVWRICETLHWYVISAEDEIGIACGEQLAYYQTAKWSEIVEFCETHCNPSNDTLHGLGCTNKELSDATINYIHSKGEKYRYE